jgi:transposase-like protein
MGRPKGVTNKQPSRYWSREAKYEYVKLITEGEMSMAQLSKDNNVSQGMLSKWVKLYHEGGIEALENKRKPGNPLAKLHNKKTLTPLEALQLENMALRIENERLKKGYTTEEVIAARQRRSSKKSTKL